MAKPKAKLTQARLLKDGNMVIHESGILTVHEQTPSDLLALAVKNNLDIEKLERLMIMQEKWEANQARKLFFQAFIRIH